MPETFDCFCIVEIFGHTRIAGRVTEQVIGGIGFIRVDVPELPAHGGFEAQPAFTRLFGAGAIYSITPVSEEIAVAAAGEMRIRPVNVYLALPESRGPGLVEEDDEEDGDDDGEDEEDSGNPIEGESYLEEDCWMCVCGNFIENGMHCPNCGAEPPWGCPCSQCQNPDENFEEGD